jgi:hypothetical protein
VALGVSPGGEKEKEGGDVGGGPVWAAPHGERRGGVTGVLQRSASTRKRRAQAGARRGGMECPGQGSQGADVWAPWPQCQSMGFNGFK